MIYWQRLILLKKDISSILQPGENTLTVSIRSSLRNLMGPHHYAPEPEPMGATPVHFTFRGQWGDGIPDSYTHTCHGVPFGIDTIYLTAEKG